MKIAINSSTLIFLTFAAAIVFQSISTSTNDVHWLIWCADQVLQGEKLYIDVYESNPPLIIWLYMPAVWLANFLQFAPIVAVRGEVFLFSALSLYCCSELLKKSNNLAAEQKKSFLLSIAGVFLLLPSNPLMFAQR